MNNDENIKTYNEMLEYFKSAGLHLLDKQSQKKEREFMNLISKMRNNSIQER
jgi:hypothetical protein